MTRALDTLPRVRDPFDPTDDEIIAWAYGRDAVALVEDWDLVLATVGRAPLLVRLAADPKCPTRDHFLRCLYLLVGDQVRPAPADAGAWEQIERVLRLADAARNPRIARWVARARVLRAHPEQFDYRLWCDGGIVDADRDSP